MINHDIFWAYMEFAELLLSTISAGAHAMLVRDPIFLPIKAIILRTGSASVMLRLSERKSPHWDYSNERDGMVKYHLNGTNGGSHPGVPQLVDANATNNSIGRQ
jgi:hypothetical protein